MVQKRSWVCVTVLIFILFMATPVLAAEDSVQKGTVRVDTVLQTKPGGAGEDMIKLGRGLTVQILSHAGGYYYVKYDDKNGYAPEGAILAQAETEKLAAKGKVKADGVNLRVKANVSASVVTQLAKGTEVDISERCGNWYKVGTPKHHGYVHIDYIDFYEPEKTEYYTELKMGMSGKAVVLLQNRLKELGHYGGDCKGVYGAMTREAIKQYQEADGLPVSGVATVETQRRLYGSAAAGE